MDAPSKRMRRIWRKIDIDRKLPQRRRGTHCGPAFDLLVWLRAGSALIPVREPSFASIQEEGFMAALEIRKDRTPAVLRKLAEATNDAGVVRRVRVASPTSAYRSPASSRPWNP